MLMSYKFPIVTTAIADYLKPYRDITVTSNVDYVDLLDLDINTHKAYLLIFEVKNPTTSNMAYFMFFEGDYVTTNYYSQVFIANGTSTWINRTNDPTFAGCNAGNRNEHVCWILRDVDGYPKVFTISTGSTGGSVTVNLWSLSKTATVTNITQIRIAAQYSGGIGAGSRIRLYRIGG
jgi:hypothetical protein